MGLFKTSAIVATLFACTVAAPRAYAAAIINITESGSNVVAFGSGSLDTTGLITGGSSSATPTIGSNNGVVLIGNGSATTYVVPSKSLGNGPDVAADSSTGSIFGVLGTRLYLPENYISLSQLGSTATFNNRTLAGLGLNTGSYVYRLPNDTLTINIAQGLTVPTPTGSVPEPSAWLMMVAGVGLLGAAMRRRTVKIHLA